MNKKKVKGNTIQKNIKKKKETIIYIILYIPMTYKI